MPGRGRPPLRPGTHGQISVRQRDDGRWIARCEVRRIDGTYASPVRRTRRTKSMAHDAARDAAQAAAASTAAGATPVGIDADTRVGDLVAAWIDQRDNLAPSSRRIYENELSQRIRPGLGHLRLREVSTAIVEGWRSTLATDAMWDRSRTVLRGAWTWAVRMGAVDRSPIDATTPAKRKARDPDALDPDQVSVLRATVAAWTTTADIPGPRPRAPWMPDFVDVLLATGMRIGQACVLTWDDIEELDDNGTVWLTPPPSKERTGTKPRRRRLAVPSYGVEALRRQRDRSGELNSPWVWPTAEGRPVTPSTVRRAWRAAVGHMTPDDRAKLPSPLTPHVLRRTVATLVAGKNLQTAQGLLGHSSAITTETYYVEKLSEVDAADTLDAAWVKTDIKPTE